MLIGTNIIGPEGIIINLREKKAYVSSYAIILEIDTKQQGSFIRRKLSAQHNLIVTPHSQALISFPSPGLPSDRDFFFEQSPSQGRIILFSHLIHHNMSSILLRNDSREQGSSDLHKTIDLGRLQKCFTRMFFMISSTPEYTACPPR